MSSFNEFAENTKNDYMVLFFGMLIIVISTFIKGIIGGTSTTLIKGAGILLLSYALILYSIHIKSYFNDHHDFFVNPEYALYRPNIFASSGLCILISVLLLYLVYTMIV